MSDKYLITLVHALSEAKQYKSYLEKHTETSYIYDTNTYNTSKKIESLDLDIKYITKCIKIIIEKF